MNQEYLKIVILGPKKRIPAILDTGMVPHVHISPSPWY